MIPTDEMVRVAAKAMRTAFSDEFGSNDTEADGYIDLESCDDKKVVRRVLEAALAHMWRPIEEAPRDSPMSRLLVCGQWQGEPMVREVKISDLGPTQSTLVRNIKPTHFMPLPSPPASQEAVDG